MDFVRALCASSQNTLVFGNWFTNFSREECSSILVRNEDDMMVASYPNRASDNYN